MAKAIPKAQAITDVNLLAIACYIGASVSLWATRPGSTLWLPRPVYAWASLALILLGIGLTFGILAIAAYWALRRQIYLATLGFFLGACMLGVAQEGPDDFLAAAAGIVASMILALTANHEWLRPDPQDASAPGQQPRRLKPSRRD